MDDELKKSLLSKREEASQKLKQAEADIYYLQGYIRAIDDLLTPPPDALTLDQLRDGLGVQSVEIVEKENQ